MNAESQRDNADAAEKLRDLMPDRGALINCIHCGLCLSSCPTYALVPIERATPRGRLALMRGVTEGELEPGTMFADQMYLCLDCRACETACPAGVRFGELIESARNLVEVQGYGSSWRRRIRILFLRGIFPRPRLLGALGWGLWFYQRSGLQFLVRRTRILELVAPKLARKERLAPRASHRRTRRMVRPVERPEQPRARVALWIGCVQDVVFPEINRQTVDILLRNGFEVVSPRKQVCCGSLHGHNGDLETARRLARRNLDVFDLENIDAIIVNAAGCGAFMRHYDHLLAKDPDYAECARLWTSKVRDVLEFLDEVGLVPPPRVNGAPPIPATYHEACHLVHGQKVSAAPRRVLAQVPGYEWRELPEATWCCGSAGVYNITHPHMAQPLGKRKVENIRSTGARIVVTGNPGCMIQIEAEAKANGVDVEVLHPVTLIHRAYTAADKVRSGT